MYYYIVQLDDVEYNKYLNVRCKVLPIHITNYYIQEFGSPIICATLIPFVSLCLK